MKKIGWLLCVMMVLACAAAPAAVTLKLATLAPDGSIWMQTLNDAKAEIEKATGGEVKVRIYPGGIMGSEKDVLFKIRTGQLHGGGFMGYGIGVVVPDAAALMFPMVFRTYGEVDSVMEKMRPFLGDDARKNGFEALGWTEVGFSYAYSVKPIPDIETLRGTKVWALDSPMMLELLSAGRISGIPANVTDVLTSLQTGALETVFGPPTAAVAVQWQTKVRYYNTARLTYALGGVFLSSAGWQSIPAAHRETVRSAFDTHCRALTPKVRQSDKEALEFMQSQGVQALDATIDAYGEFEKMAATALGKIKGKIFSEAAWTTLQGFLAEARK